MDKNTVVKILIWVWGLIGIGFTVIYIGWNWLIIVMIALLYITICLDAIFGTGNKEVLDEQ